MPATTTYTISFIIGGVSSETIQVSYKANDETTYTILDTLPGLAPGVTHTYTMPPLESHRMYTVILETLEDGTPCAFGGIRYLCNFICSPFTAEFSGGNMNIEWECYVPESSGDSVKEYKIEYRPLGSTGAFTSVIIPIATVTTYWAANPGSYPFYTEQLTGGFSAGTSYEINHYTTIEYNFYGPSGLITPVQVIINSSSPCSTVLESVPCETCEALGFDTSPSIPGLYVDNDSPMLVNFNGGTFDNYFLKVGQASTADGVGSSITFLYRSMIYIDNPSSVYFKKIAIKSVSWNAGFFSRVQIWDPGTDPVTPTFVDEFVYPRSGFGKHLFGTMGYDAVDDALYLSSYGAGTLSDFRLVKLDLATGTYIDYLASGFSFFYPPTPWSFNPFPQASGDNAFSSVIVNPVTRRRYLLTNGVLVFPPNSGAIGILAPDNNTVERVFPHDSAPLIVPGSTAYPANLRTEVAPSSGIAFDSVGNAYMVSRTNCTPYNLGQHDVVVLDAITHDYITSINYDATQTWLPYSNNNYTWNHVSSYDGSGFIPGEKILVLYRNYGPANPLIPVGPGNGWTTSYPGNSARLVAIDTTTYTTSVIIEIPDSVYGAGIDAFVYSYKYNKIFFSTGGGLNKIVAYDENGLSIYNENQFPSGGGNSYTYQGLEAYDSGRIVYINGAMNPNVNMYVIEPAALCAGEVAHFPENPSVTLDGPYKFNDTTNSWDALSSTVVTIGVTDFTVTTILDPSIIDAVLLLSTDGGLTYLPYQDQGFVLYDNAAAWSAGRVYDKPPGFPFQYSFKVQMNSGTCAYTGPYCVIPCAGTSPSGPLGPITGVTAGICNASNENYSLGTSDAIYYTWDLPVGVTSATSFINLNVIILNFGPGFTSGTLTVTAHYCYGVTQTSSIFIDGTPLAPTLDTTTIAPDSDFLYTASSTGATSYNWTIVSDVAPDFDFCTNPSTCSQWYIYWNVAMTSATVTVTATNSCGTSAPTIFSYP